MSNKFLVTIAAVALTFTACKQNSNTPNKSDKDTDSVAVEQPKPDLVGDEDLTSTAKYYADMVNTENSKKILTKVDELVGKDMKDLRDSCKFLLYPFSGPDFLYPHTILPDADIYFMIGLERPGSQLKPKGESKQFVESYKKALRVYLGSSFFITKEMKVDLANDVIDGTLPVISMLVAKEGCQIVSIKYKNFAEGGQMVDATEKTADMVEVQFFSPATPKHLQTIYYFSGNAKNKGIDPNLVTYLNNTLPKYKVLTFFKAASYLLYHDTFSTIRDIVLNNSMAILGDDSGMPFYSYDKSKWDMTLYGAYKRPQSCFNPKYFQTELDSLYKSGIARPLEFRIGYNRPSNWMVARKK